VRRSAEIKESIARRSRRARRGLGLVSETYGRNTAGCVATGGERKAIYLTRFQANSAVPAAAEGDALVHFSWSPAKVNRRC
jgi:hypothetical protein